MNLESGLNAVGTIANIESEAWSNNPDKFNHKIVLAQKYTDRYGSETVNYLHVNLSGETLPMVKDFKQRAGDKRVVLPVRHKLKSGTSKAGKPYAFIEFFLPKDSKLEII